MSRRSWKRFSRAAARRTSPTRSGKSPRLINVSYVRQGEPLGLGHAVLVTETIVGDEPFAVILADDVIDATPPALQQMIDVFERAGGPVLAVERVPMDQVSSYGVDRRRAGARARQGRVSRDGSRREAAAQAKRRRTWRSSAATSSRPIFFRRCTRPKKDKSGEIQLTNGLRHLLKSRPIYAYEVDGVRHDTGNKLGFLKASVYFALKRPELAKGLQGLPFDSDFVSLFGRASCRSSCRSWSSSRLRFGLGLGLCFRLRGVG